MHELTCREFIDFLDDYVDGNQEDDVCARFEGHIEECPYGLVDRNTDRDTMAWRPQTSTNDRRQVANQYNYPWLTVNSVDICRSRRQGPFAFMVL